MLAPTSRRFATPVACNRGHPHDSPCHLAQNTNHATPMIDTDSIPRGTPHGPDAEFAGRAARRSLFDAKAIDPEGTMAGPPILAESHCETAEGGMSLSPADPGMVSTDGARGATSGTASPPGPGSVACCGATGS